VSRRPEFGNGRGKWLKWFGPWGYEGVECGRIEAYAFERLAMELDSGLGNEAFANHPTKCDSGQAVPSFIRDRSPTNVCKTMSGPSTPLQDKEKITAVTPSKPNFLHVGLSQSVIVCLFVRFTLVMVFVILSVIVREAMV
jgi:hypothetical protein